MIRNPNQEQVFETLITQNDDVVKGNASKTKDQLVITLHAFRSTVK